MNPQFVLIGRLSLPLPGYVRLRICRWLLERMRSSQVELLERSLAGKPLQKEQHHENDKDKGDKTDGDDFIRLFHSLNDIAGKSVELRIRHA